MSATPATLPPPLFVPKGRSWWMVVPAVVLLLLVMLTVLALMASCDNSYGARHSQIQADLNHLRFALENYQAHSAALPTTEQGLKALTEKPTVAPVPTQHRKIMKMVLHDPWGREYGYRSPADWSDEDYDLWSVGPDGLDGTADDIGNWNDE